VSTALAIERTRPGEVRVGGRLGFAEASAALARSSEVVEAGRDVAVDVAALAGVDSATLAVLLAWAARARAAGGSLRYVAAPDGLRALARLCDSEGLLGLAPATASPRGGLDAIAAS
jgi:phospholipid transport system transporter-binding protein